MRLILVRHAATENNDTGLLQEDHSPLNSKGEIQAQFTAQRLKDEDINCIYTSPHKRTQQTAKELAKHHSEAKYCVAKEIRERDFGVFKGKPGEQYSEWRTKNNLSWSEAKPEGGESYHEVRARVLNFLAKVKQEYHDKTVVFVSHGGVLTQLVLDLLQQPETKESFDAHIHHNAAITIIQLSDKAEPIAIGCRRHLPEKLLEKRGDIPEPKQPSASKYSQ